MGERSSRIFQRGSRIGRAAVAGASVLGVAFGCSSSEDEQLRAAELAGHCALNSDCVNPFVCVFERCHRACTEDRDCPNQLRCVRGERDGEMVCQLPDETACEVDRDCPGKQICGAENECRDSCAGDQSCVATQVCSSAGQCLSSEPGKDGAGGAAQGTGGSGNGGAAGSGSSSSAGAGGDRADASAGGTPSGTGGHAPASGGVGGTSAGGGAGDSGVASGGTDGGAASGGAGGATTDAGLDGAGGGGSTFDFYETSDGVETVPNDDRDHAVPVVRTASIYLSNSNYDWFSVTAPDDGRGHLITLHVTQTASLSTSVQAVAQADFSQIGVGSLDFGVTTNAYVTVGPNTVTLFRFLGNFGGDGRAELTFDLTAEDDANEPNSTKSRAKPIALNTNVGGQMIKPYVSAIDVNADDVFAVDLAAGTATVSIGYTPQSLAFEVLWIDLQNVTRSLGTTAIGALRDFTFSPTNSGTFYVILRPFQSTNPMVIGAKPAYMSEQYSFQVKQ